MINKKDNLCNYSLTKKSREGSCKIIKTRISQSKDREFSKSTVMNFGNFGFSIYYSNLKDTFLNKDHTYLPIFDSSSNSDGDRFFRRHKAASIPALISMQHRKSTSNSNRTTTATAMPTMAAEDKTGESMRVTRSDPGAHIHNYVIKMLFSLSDLIEYCGWVLVKMVKF